MFSTYLSISIACLLFLQSLTLFFFSQTIVFIILSGVTLAVLYLMSFTWLKFLTGRNYVRRDERDYVREYRGAYVRERELQRQRDRERLQRLLDTSSDSDEVTNLAILIVTNSFITPVCITMSRRWARGVCNQGLNCFVNRLRPII